MYAYLGLDEAHSPGVHSLIAKGKAKSASETVWPVVAGLPPRRGFPPGTTIHILSNNQVNPTKPGKRCARPRGVLSQNKDEKPFAGFFAVSVLPIGRTTGTMGEATVSFWGVLINDRDAGLFLAKHTSVRHTDKQGGGTRAPPRPSGSE